jgi:hypothetical protein
VTTGTDDKSSSPPQSQRMQGADTRTRQESRENTGSEPAVGGEFLYYLRRYMRWSILPILLVLGLLALLISLGGSGAAPFIYRLF